MKYPPVRILIVDDDVDYQFLCQRVLRNIPTGSVNCVACADEAIAYLLGEGKFSDRKAFPFPTLILSDLNMPHGDGFDLLEFMQANPGWIIVPRIILSSSDDNDDVRTAYSLGASVYHRKPLSYEEMKLRIRSIVEYWSTAELTPCDETGRTLPTNSQGRLGARFPQMLATAMCRVAKSAHTTEIH